MALSPSHLCNTSDSPQSATPSGALQGSSLSDRWQVLHKTSGRIAQMADLAPEPIEPLILRFEQALTGQALTEQALSGPMVPAHAIAKRGLEDIELLAKLGLKALQEVEARGQATTAPALALWREFYHAREAVLSALEPAAA